MDNVFDIINGIALTIILLLLLIIIFYIWMIFDCIRRKYTDPYEKNIWLMTIVFTGLIYGTILYFFFGRVKGDNPTSGNRRALYSLILADLGLCFPFIGVAFSIPAILTGHFALKEIRMTAEKGRGMAITGLILGYLNVALYSMIVLLVSFLVLFG